MTASQSKFTVDSECSSAWGQTWHWSAFHRNRRWWSPASPPSPPSPSKHPQLSSWVLFTLTGQCQCRRCTLSLSWNVSVAVISWSYQLEGKLQQKTAPDSLIATAATSAVVAVAACLSLSLSHFSANRLVWSDHNQTVVVGCHWLLGCYRHLGCIPLGQGYQG